MQTAQAIVTRSRQQWAAQINAEWAEGEEHARKAVECWISVGESLIAAKHELLHGEFCEMIERDLAFGIRKANRLMKIAGTPHLANRTTSSNLPAAWNTLYELAKLAPDDFKDASERGLVDENTNYRSAHATAGAYSVPQGETWGAGQSPIHLPSSKDAKRIAQQTGRTIAGADGRFYTPMSDDAAADHEQRRSDTYGTLEAIKKIAGLGVDPKRWLDQAEDHWLIDFSLGEVETAAEWLTALSVTYRARNRILDGDNA